MPSRCALGLLALLSALFAAIAIAHAQPADGTPGDTNATTPNTAANETTDAHTTGSVASVAERVRRLRHTLRSPSCSGAYLDSQYAQGFDSRATVANALLASWLAQSPADSAEVSAEGIAIRLAFAFALEQYGPDLAQARGDFEGQGIDFEPTIAAMTRALRILATRTEPTLNYAVLYWRHGEPKDSDAAARTQLFETIIASLPAELGERMRVDAPTATILWVGPLSDANAKALRGASADPRWVRAIDVLADRIYVSPTLAADERSEFLWRFDDVADERVKQIEQRYRTVCNAPEGLATAVSCGWADPMRTAIRGYLAMGADIGEVDLHMAASFDKIRQGELISPLTQPRGGTWVAIVIALAVAGVGLIGLALWRFRKPEGDNRGTAASTEESKPSSTASAEPATPAKGASSKEAATPERARLADAIRRELDEMA